ncbi:MAG: hypothetical protein ACLPVY_10450 [Acidimicrobiia bacterium]
MRTYQKVGSFSSFDLRHVVAAQPHVFCASAGRRFADVAELDLAAIAAQTLPVERQIGVAIMALAEPVGQLKMLKVTSDDTTVHAELGPDGALRFVGQLSYMQVARFQGRCILRDGYHRAVELLSRNVSQVPVLYREVADIDALFPPAQRPGMLPESAWLGEQPPLLGDYLDPQVSALLDVPKPAKALIVQVAELPWP